MDILLTILAIAGLVLIFAAPEIFAFIAVFLGTGFASWWFTEYAPWWNIVVAISVTALGIAIIVTTTKDLGKSYCQDKKPLKIPIEIWRWLIIILYMSVLPALGIAGLIFHQEIVDDEGKFLLIHVASVLLLLAWIASRFYERSPSSDFLVSQISPGNRKKVLILSERHLSQNESRAILQKLRPHVVLDEYEISSMKTRLPGSDMDAFLVSLLMKAGLERDKILRTRYEEGTAYGQRFCVVWFD